jgi:uncharacterized SAM-binding protein YcdF (DUF218 family)
LGSIWLLSIVLAFSSLPFHAWYSHSLVKAGIHRPPDYIVVLGGGGMPSETGLMRTWYGALTAKYFNRSKVIIALPGNSNDSTSSIILMKKELVMRGIDKDRILLEDSGANTRAQAINIFKRFTNKLSIVNCQLSILIVTSPDHLTRAVLTFKKAGFMKVDGIPAFERAIESDITFNAKKIGGEKWVPDVGENFSLRYGFWTQLRYEQLVLREYIAIGYYWMMGWI